MPSGSLSMLLCMFAPFFWLLWYSFGHSMSSRKVLFMVWAAAILATGAGTWAVQSGALKGQTVPLGTFRVSAGSVQMDSNNTLQIPDSVTSVLFEWNALPGYTVYPFSVVPHAQWGNTKSPTGADTRAANGIQAISNPGTQTFFAQGYWNSPAANEVIKLVNIYQYKSGKNPIAGLGGAPLGTFRAFGENGETVDGTNTIRLPEGTRLILEWNALPGYTVYPFSVVPHAQWGNTKSPTGADTRAANGIQAISNPGTQTFFAQGYWNSPAANEVIKSINVIVYQPVCGNSAIEGNESCDDGNATAGDGCSASCTVETGFTCTGSPKSTCTRNCGNGVIGNGETCDDANSTAGDGCSATCALESGYSCPTPGQACTVVCGDGIKKGAETCDDSNTTAGDGCSASCTVEAGYSCPTAGQACQKTCGNGTKDAGEGCDDRNTASGDGCSDACALETGYACPTAGQACAPVCGDGIRTGSEACDDSNKQNGDGCSATCQPEPGFNCGSTSCVPVCGDGQKKGNEACDDGNPNGGDGCSSTCTVEAGYSCNGTTCAPTCGDRVRTGNEQCDDGNAASGDGCSSCQQEAGWTCGSTSCVPQCGDGQRKGNEACDDGNTANSDGCSASCAIDSGWTCAGAPSQCTRNGGAASSVAAPVVSSVSSVPRPASSAPASVLSVAPKVTMSVSSAPKQQSSVAVAVASAAPAASCGNGIKESGEACDDRNAAAGDGCSSSCQFEVGWICAGTPSLCAKLPAASSVAAVTQQASSLDTHTAAPMASSVFSSVPPVSPTVSSSSAALEQPQVNWTAPQWQQASAVSSVANPVLSLQLTPPPVASAQSQASLAPQAWKPVCGNGRVEIGEACDVGAQNSDRPGAICRSNCSLARCGDGIADDPQEQCDRGAANSDAPGASCTSACRVGTQTLAANTVVAPLPMVPLQVAQQALVPQVPQTTAAFLPPLPQYSYPPQTTSSGPGSIAVMAAGAAAGVGFMRRKRSR